MHDAARVQVRHAGRDLGRDRQHGLNVQLAVRLAALAEPVLRDGVLRKPG